MISLPQLNSCCIRVACSFLKLFQSFELKSCSINLVQIEGQAYSNEEIENNYITNRNARSRNKSGINSNITLEDDLGQRHLPVCGKNFGRDIRAQAYTTASTNVLQYNGAETNHEKSVALFEPRSLYRKDMKLKFPPLKNNEDHPDSFFSSIKSVVQMAQFFSLLPVSGCGGPNYLSLSFRWIHWKLIYSLLLLTSTVFILACTVLRNISHGLTYDKSANLVFFGSSLMGIILLLNLATKWKDMNKDFAEMEFKLYRYNYPQRITKEFRIFTGLFMIFALVEHILSRIAEFKRIQSCAIGDSFFNVIEAFFANYYYEIFYYISYSPWIGVMLMVTQFVCTFTWNFTDLLLTLISWTICRRFKRFNEVLFNVQGKEKDYYFWRRTRMDYNELTDLTRKVDAHVQKLMLLSLGDNLYFICIQLLKGLNSNRKNDNLYERIYFIWSVGFLIARTCFVAFTAAGINDESKEAKTVLYSVPESGYNAETRRFLTQLTTNDVALTGCKFFSITRGLILTIAGTVVTYEVILVQFNTGDNDATGTSNKTNCFYF